MRGKGMQKILDLLKERNTCFEKFKAINNAELIRIKSGDFNNIDIFYRSRENILNMVSNFEELIEKRVTVASPEGEIPREMKIDLMKVLREKDNLIKYILAQDLEIMSLIEEAKTQIIYDLRTLTTGRKALNAYQHGTKVRTLDEEI